MPLGTGVSVAGIGILVAESETKPKSVKLSASAKEWSPSQNPSHSEVPTHEAAPDVFNIINESYFDYGQMCHDIAGEWGHQAVAPPQPPRQKWQSEDPSRRKGYKVSVGNLPLPVDKPGIIGILRCFGKIRLSEFCDDGSTATCTVTFAKVRGVNTTVKRLHGADFNGSPMIVFAHSSNSGQSKLQRAVKKNGSGTVLSIDTPATSETLVFKNLAFDLTATQFEAALAEAQVTPLSIAFHRGRSGEFKGITFVQFQSTRTAGIAFRALQGKQVLGRQMRIEFKLTETRSAADSNSNWRSPPSKRAASTGASGSGLASLVRNNMQSSSSSSSSSRASPQAEGTVGDSSDDWPPRAPESVALYKQLLKYRNQCYAAGEGQLPRPLVFPNVVSHRERHQMQRIAARLGLECGVEHDAVVVKPAGNGTTLHRIVGPLRRRRSSGSMDQSSSMAAPACRWMRDKPRTLSENPMMMRRSRFAAAKPDARPHRTRTRTDSGHSHATAIPVVGSLPVQPYIFGKKPSSWGERSRVGHTIKGARERSDSCSCIYAEGPDNSPGFSRRRTAK